MPSGDINSSRPHVSSSQLHQSISSVYETSAISTYSMHFNQSFPLHLILTLIVLSGINCHNTIKCLQDEGIQQTKEFIRPMVVVGNNDKHLLMPLNPENFKCPDRFTLYVPSSGSRDRIVIDLIKNKRLISSKYFQIANNQSDNNFDDEFDRKNLFLKLHNFNSNDDHCHYHEDTRDDSGVTSAISIVNRSTLSGLFQNANQVYYLHSIPSNSSTYLTSTSHSCSPGGKSSIVLNETVNRTNDNRRSSRYKRASSYHSSNSSADNYVKHAPYKSNSSSLYVELLIVHDHTQYKEFGGDTAEIAERSLQIVNIMNAFYRQLNVFVALVGVVLWVEKDEIELTDDGDATLTNFLKYRHDKLLPRYHHDNAQLITNTSFNGSVVGKALKGPICTHEHSGGVSTDHSSSPAVVAVTLSHELGHNFGMEHDEEDKCKCPDEKCIMSASSNAVHPKYWSSCSIDYFEEARRHGLLECLKNQPEKVFGPICGNGFVEEGEDCDLGTPLPTHGSSKRRNSSQTSGKCEPGQVCNVLANPCCDRRTCKFAQNATCAQGSCCDLSICSVYNATQKVVCREKQTECDLEEMCDGRNEYCPADVYYHDGIECGPARLTDGHNANTLNESNSVQSYCYKGRCASHESQCQLLWGSASYVSRNICYEQNVHGNTSGNCGYNHIDKIYKSCETEDILCGMLHCVHNQPPSPGEARKTGKLNYGFESATIFTVSFFTPHFNSPKIYCHGAIIDAGSEMRDPGLVPDGAACGIDRMCVKQKCLPVYDIVYDNWCPSDCNGNGICDNMGVCHCNDGTIGTSCYQFFGGNFQLSLFIYMIMFFVPVITLIVFAINHYKNQIKLWWFLHNRKKALKARESSSGQRRLRQDLQGGKIVISEPIPLSSVNGPFHKH